jgi:hypothetical protein
MVLRFWRWIMFQRQITFGITVAVLICLLVSASVIQAADSSMMQEPLVKDVPAQEATAGTMLFDLVVLRPLGFVGTVLGTAAFVVSLPFSLPTKSTDEAAQKLVVDPATYTFARPLGQIDGLLYYPK